VSPETVKTNLEAAVRKIRAFLLAHGYSIRTVLTLLTYAAKKYM
jgi:hypothetical protein